MKTLSILFTWLFFTFNPYSMAPAGEPHTETGMAAYYNDRYDGKRTANGETYQKEKFTAAHRTLPFGTEVKVTNLANGRSVTVRINDRGPFTKSRIIDLSRAAAQEIGLLQRGTGKVKIEYEK